MRRVECSLLILYVHMNHSSDDKKTVFQTHVQVGAGEIGPLQVRAAQVGVRQVAAAQIGHLEVDVTQIKAGQISAAEVKTLTSQREREEKFNLMWSGDDGE